MIHVAYRLWGGDGFFAKMCAVSMLSMFENTKEQVIVHIIHNSTLTQDNHDKFCHIAKNFNQQIEFHDIEKIAWDILSKFETVYPTTPEHPEAAWYPFALPKIFPNLEKIISIGTDMVINLDIAELWAYDVSKEVGIAAVPEILSGMPPTATVPIINGRVKHEDYFNDDVMLLNLAFVRENLQDIIDSVKFVHDNHYYCAEQDALNLLYSTKYLKLPRKFNALITYLREKSEQTIGKEIYHLTGSAKPDLNTDDVYNRLYLEYFLKTPYATVDIFGNMGKECVKLFKRTYNESKEFLLHFTNLLAERKRAFFVDKSNLDAVRQIFAMKNDELIIDASSPLALGNLLLEMQKSQGKKIFFIMFGEYLALRNALIQRGFVENEDFVNLLSFLSEKNGLNVDFDTKEIVQAM